MLPATEKNLRSFGLVMAGALCALGAFILWKGSIARREAFAGGLAAAGLLFGVLGLTSPLTLRAPFKVWMGLAHYLGMVMTSVLMTVFYFTLLVPFTLLRLKDPLRLRLGGTTYWEPYKNAEPTLERFQRPF